MQNAVESVPALARLALASAGGVSAVGGGRGAGGRGALSSSPSAAAAGVNATFTIRTPFGVDADRGDGVLGWLSLEGSKGVALEGCSQGIATVPAGAPPAFAARARDRRKDLRCETDAIGRGEPAGSEAPSLLVLPHGGAAVTASESLLLGDRTARAPVVLIRQCHSETASTDASAVATRGVDLGFFAPPADRPAGVTARSGVTAPAASRISSKQQSAIEVGVSTPCGGVNSAGAGRADQARVRNRPSWGSEDAKNTSGSHDDRYPVAETTPFVSAGLEMRARGRRKRDESFTSVTADGSRGETTHVEVDCEVRLVGLPILC